MNSRLTNHICSSGTSNRPSRFSVFPPGTRHASTSSVCLPQLARNATACSNVRMPAMSSSSTVPRHMRSPGDDGYRTPTIEDAQLNFPVLRVSDSRGSQGIQSSAVEQLHNLSQRATDRGLESEQKDCGDCLDHNSLHRTLTGYSAKSLSWKKRIRHVTWAYFTSTMATGGLANVLYEGMHFLRIIVDQANLSSPVPVSRSRYNRNCCLSDQYRPVPVHLGPADCTVL